MILPETFSREKNTINAIIETPRGTGNKYAYDVGHDFFHLKKVLPLGTFFPLDFGFVPHTRGQDGDPFDVLIINDFPSFPGCVIEARIIGVLEASQQQKNRAPIRNDRIMAVASASLCYSHLKKIQDLNPSLLNELVHFFEYYNQMEGKKFRLLSIQNTKVAIKLIQNNLHIKS